jgi:hypothetical protein
MGTLRQYLDQKAQQSLPIVALVALPSIAIMLFAPKPYKWAALGGIAFIVWFLCGGARRIPCPRCKHQIGELGSAYLAAKGGGRSVVAHRRRVEQLGKCPHCGLRLDEETAATSPEGIARD